ncbi:MAG TPA: hypothetical protein VF545_01950 [Thermoleophilaceae bacterium]|jgi:hypothetical protein
MDASLLPPPAHETWFEHRGFHTDWGFAGESATLLLLGLALMLTLAVRALARLHPGIDVPLLARMAPWMPFALRIHLAVSLVGLASRGDFLSPAMDLPTNAYGIAVGVAMVVVAVAMVTGYRVREASLLLVALGPVGLFEFGLWDVLARVDLLGLAGFLLLAGPGAWSADVELGRVRATGAFELAKGVWALRLAVGAALVVVAFQEKLANPNLGQGFLHEHPDFNVARSILGLDWTDLEFIRVAGAIEVLFGLLLISGALPQAAVVIAGIPFNATLWFFGTVELLGHLPTYGTMLVLLVLGSHPLLRAATSDPWPFGRRERYSAAPP